MERAKQFLALLPAPAYLFDAQRERFLGANDLFLDLIGYSMPELVELDWRKLVVPEEIGIAERALESGTHSKPTVWRFTHKGGQVVELILINRRMDFVGADGQVYDVFMSLVVDRENAIPAEQAYPVR